MTIYERMTFAAPDKLTESLVTLCQKPHLPPPNSQEREDWTLPLHS